MRICDNLARLEFPPDGEKRRVRVGAGEIVVKLEVTFDGRSRIEEPCAARRAAFIIARVKNGVVNQDVRRGFADGVIDKSPERKSLVGGIVPVVVAAPVAVEVEIRDVIVSPLVAESLIEDGREMRRDLAIPRGVSALRATFGTSRGRALRGNDSSRADEVKAPAQDEGEEQFFSKYQDDSLTSKVKDGNE